MSAIVIQSCFTTAALLLLLRHHHAPTTKCVNASVRTACWPHLSAKLSSNTRASCQSVDRKLSSSTRASCQAVDPELSSSTRASCPRQKAVFEFPTPPGPCLLASVWLSLMRFFPHPYFTCMHVLAYWLKIRSSSFFFVTKNLFCSSAFGAIDFGWIFFLSLTFLSPFTFIETPEETKFQNLTIF